ncbi:hypothetical protein CspeluHIS016_0500880 [Cutaneotrichosporon spelunceum]|uniref:F-box domain-containing protein n=1 Tax=Cutaneotrichosporon spelunceum TaxID=1672016 RepID=A0AAD3YCG9_9TREE|nr:hypothetical protein CspeluHIS016_0500880 [Cutaneotrichosporon spelunceum]
MSSLPALAQRGAALLEPRMDTLSLEDLNIRSFRFPSSPAILSVSPPQSATPEPVCSKLDRTAFPHIFDTVFKYAPYESLLILRATCSELRDHVDEVLLHHIVVRAPVSTSLIGRLLGTLATPPSCVRSVLGRMPRADWSLDGHLADAVRVVDIDHADGPWDLGGVDELRRLQHVAVVRYRGSYLRNMDPDSGTLDPTNVLGSPETIVRMHRSGHPVMVQYPRADATIIASPVYYTTTTPLLWCSNATGKSGIEGKTACAYLFQRVQDGALPAVDSIYAGHMVRSIAQAALRPGVLEVILVEGEAWAKSWNEHAGTWRERQMRHSLRTVILDAAHAIAPRPRDRDKVAKVRRKLKFMSLEQYRSVLGENKYDLVSRW